MVHRNGPLSETGRLRLARCVVDEGWPLRRAAERFQVSVTCAQRWAGRYRLQGDSGLTDRSSRPHHSPRRLTARRERRIIGLRVSRRWGPARIGGHLRIAASTVYAVLRPVRAGSPHPSRPRHRCRGAPLRTSRNCSENTKTPPSASTSCASWAPTPTWKAATAPPSDCSTSRRPRSAPTPNSAGPPKTWAMPSAPCPNSGLGRGHPRPQAGRPGVASRDPAERGSAGAQPVPPDADPRADRRRWPACADGAVRHGRSPAAGASPATR